MFSQKASERFAEPRSKVMIREIRAKARPIGRTFDELTSQVKAMRSTVHIHGGRVMLLDDGLNSTTNPRHCCSSVVALDVGCLIGNDGKVVGGLDPGDNLLQNDIPNNVDEKILRLIADVGCVSSACGSK